MSKNQSMLKPLRNRIYRAFLRSRKELLSFAGALAYRDEPLAYPPVFILGPARSGTTLLYQLLGKAGSFCYITNYEQDRWWMRSLILKREVKQWKQLPGPADFSSEMGKTEGPGNLSQGFKIWDDVLPSEYPDVSPEEIHQRHRLRIRNEVRIRENAWDAPFLGKWPAMAVNPELWEYIFPEAFFIRIKRDEFDNAVSLLKSRRKTHGNDVTPITRQPAAALRYRKESGHLQVAAYVHYTNKLLDEFEERCQRIIHIDYKKLCGDLAGQLQKIEDHYQEVSSYNMNFDYRKIAEPLEARTARGLSRDDNEQIKQALYDLKSS